MTLLFAFATFFCVYTYVAFPLLLQYKVSRRQRDVGVAVDGQAPESDGMHTADTSDLEHHLPTVSIVIAAHNELGNLPAKVASLSAIEYPLQQIECIFVSDGSTDGTVEYLQKVCLEKDNWQVVHYRPASGKPTALNLGVATATGDVLVFMDARQSVSANAIVKLVYRLAQPGVGAVSGELCLLDDNGQEEGRVGLYWRYEKWIRKNESILGSTTGATGALYAIHRRNFRPLAADTLLDDFDTPVATLKNGLRTVFEPAAKAFDRAEANPVDEFHRKSRTLAGNFQSFSRNGWLFNPSQNPVWWQFLSHKVFRLLVPYALVLAFFAAMLGDTVFLRFMFALQCLFYALGLLGFAGLNNRIVSTIRLFLQLNAAAVVGAWRAIRGNNNVRWKRS